MRTPPTKDHLVGFWQFLYGAEDDDGSSGNDDGPTGGGDQNSTNSSANSDDDSQDGDDSTDDDDDGDTQISLREARKLRRENAALRAQKKEAEEKLSEKEKAELSEAERAKVEAEEAKQRAQQLEADLEQERFSRVLINAAATEKFNDPEDALVYISLDDVKRNDDGSFNKASLNAAVKALAKDKPYLIASTSSGSGDGGSRGSSSSDDGEQERRWSDSIAKKGGVKIR